MINGMIGKKLGMTSIFTPDGRNVPVTVVELGPCVVTQVKTETKEGYNALQLGFGERKASRVKKPIAGHLKACDRQNFAVLKEFKVETPGEFQLGQVIESDLFTIGEHVHVSGYMKGRGYAGVIKRHGFHGGKDTHGSHSHRVPGSIGCSAWPGKVIKGKKMPGHYGNSRKTIKNLKIVDIRPDENLIMIKGAIPGAVNSIVEVKKR